MLQLQAYMPGFLLGLVTVAGLVAEPGTGRSDEAGEPAAIPASQRDVDSDVVTTSSDFISEMPNTVVTFTNKRNSPRDVIVTFSAEALVTDLGDALELYFRIDDSGLAIGGPVVFTRSTAMEARTAVHVFTIGPGTHTIKPMWRMTDLNFNGVGFAQVFARTLIVEGLTE